MYWTQPLLLDVCVVRCFSTLERIKVSVVCIVPWITYPYASPMHPLAGDLHLLLLITVFCIVPAWARVVAGAS